MIKLKKITFFILFTILFSIILFFIFEHSVFALGEPKLVSKINSAFENIESWLLKLSTPAAAVAVGTGVFMKKFSFGDEERIRMGKKIIKSSLFSYAFILAIDLILSAIKSLIN
ncbi:MAG: pilin [Clostridia bacterium]